MTNEYSLLKAFCEGLYKASIFYVQHLHKVCMDEFLTLKKIVKHTFKKYYNANTTIFNACLTKHLQDHIKNVKYLFS